MFLVLLALIDLFASAMCAFYGFGHPFPHLQAIAAVLLLAKALIFIRSSLSALDIICSLMMLLLFWMQLPFLSLILAAYLGIKGLYSFA
jgi:hypothetical protein